VNKLERGADYRYRYFKANKGLFGFLYFCPYCGKFLWNKKKIEIDHIHAIKKVQYNRRLRKRYYRSDHGVNDLSNLTASCSRCNRQKGRKGGIWVFYGHFGKYFMPIIRKIMQLGVIFLFWFFVLPLIPEAWEFISTILGRQ